jgi:putative transposase
VVRAVLHQAWGLGDDASKAGNPIRNLARRLEQDAPGVSASIVEGLDEILTVTWLRLAAELRRALAGANILEDVMGAERRVCRNVKRWRSASIALRWTAAAMQEAAKGFRRLKVRKKF